MKPYFIKPPKLLTTWLLATIIPSLYLASQYLISLKMIFWLEILFFLLPALFSFYFFELRSALEMSHFIKNAFNTIVQTIGLFIALQIFIPFWLNYFPMSENYQTVLKSLFSQNSSYAIYLNLFKMALIPALCEEFFFRGVVLIALAQKIPEKLALIITALFFSVFHLNIALFPFYFLIGIWTGLVFLRKRNIFLAILIHFTNNALSVILFSYLGNTGLFR